MVIHTISHSRLILLYLKSKNNTIEGLTEIEHRQTQPHTHVHDVYAKRLLTYRGRYDRPGKTLKRVSLRLLTNEENSESEGQRNDNE